MKRITIADDIASYLETHSSNGATATRIAQGIQANFNTVRGRLSEMARNGEVVKNSQGFYTLASVDNGPLDEAFGLGEVATNA